MVKKYKNIEKLPRLIHRIIGQNYELLGLFWFIANAELARGKTQAEAFTEAWKWVKDQKTLGG